MRETSCLYVFELKEDKKIIFNEKLGKSSIADHIWSENGTHYGLWSEVRIIERV